MTLPTIQTELNQLFYCLQYCSKFQRTFKPHERFAINYRRALLMEEISYLQNNQENEPRLYIYERTGQDPSLETKLKTKIEFVLGIMTTKRLYSLLEEHV